jgi:ectoine hydroxylase-related dioxygenase (phytanoyl-CoA dioxygenase family)
MPWTILEKLWQRTLNPEKKTFPTEESTWNKEIETLYRLGIGMEETLRYLYFENPDFETFKSWVNNNKKEKTIEYNALEEDVLSEEDLAFWEENGYVIIRNAISKSECDETQLAIWNFLEMDPSKKETWYNQHKEQRGLMVTFSNHVTLNRNRESLQIQKAYEQLYKTTKIYKTIDKISFNPPETENYRFLGSTIHWDVSLKTPIPFGLQGLLYLTDCNANDGAFHCVPGFQHKINSWLNDLPANLNPREIALERLKPIPVIGNAGDFIIWHQALPHCASPNHGTSPRMVQYITYFPEDYKESSDWI